MDLMPALETAAAKIVELEKVRDAQQQIIDGLHRENRKDRAELDAARARVAELEKAARHGVDLHPDAVPTAGTTGDPDYPDVSGGGVPHLPVTPPPHPIDAARIAQAWHDVTCPPSSSSD